MRFGQFIRTGVISAGLAVLPAVAQTPVTPDPQPGMPPAAHVDRDDTDYDYGWVGLLGLAGLIGLWRGSRRHDVDNRRTGPNV